MKKNLFSVLALLLVFGFLFSINAEAFLKNGEIESSSISESQRVFFEDRGIVISENAKVGLAPINTSAEDKIAYALYISQTDGNKNRTDYFVAYDEEIDDYGQKTYTSVSPASGEYSGSMGVYSSYSIIIHYTVEWDFYPSSSGTYVRPLQLTWSYEKKNNSVNVTKIKCKYVTAGAKCYSSNFAFIQDGFRHNIEKTAFNPAEYTDYYSYNPLSSSYVIDLSGMSGGMAVFADFTIDGSSISDSVMIIGAVS